MCPDVIDKARKNANREIRLALEQSKGHNLPHPDSPAERAELYREDRVHLLEVGMDNFLSELQQGLWKVLVRSVGTSA